MARFETVRFASGSAETPWSTIWRIVSAKEDIYIGSSKGSMALMKVSLHQESGVWVYAANTGTGIALGNNGNRRAIQWPQPLERDGITRGPAILVPWTDIGLRSAIQERKKVHWVPPPPPDHSVEFGIFIVRPGVAFPLDSGEYLLADQVMTRGSRILLTAKVIPQSADFRNAIYNKIESETLAIADVRENVSAYILWMSRSKCEIGHPVIIQLPVKLI